MIIHPSETEESVQAAVSRCKSVIEKHSGTFLKEEDWGLKTLAFELKKQSKGRYVLLAYSADPAVVGDLEQNFNVMENVIKYMTVKLEKAQVEAYAKKARAEQAETAPAAQPQPSETAESAPAGT